MADSVEIPFEGGHHEKSRGVHLHHLSNTVEWSMHVAMGLVSDFFSHLLCIHSSYRGAVGSMFLVLPSFFAYIYLCVCASEWAHSPTVDFSYFYFFVAVTSNHVKIEWWGVGVVVCLEQGADCLHMVQLMPLHPRTPSSLASFKSRLVLPFWYRLTQVVLEKTPLNGCSSSSGYL